MNDYILFWGIWLMGSIISYFSMRSLIRANYTYKTCDRSRNIVCSILFTWIYLVVIFIVWLQEPHGGKEVKW